MEMITFQCPGCGQALRSLPSRAGREIRCPRCKASVKVPDASGAAPARAPGAEGRGASAVKRRRCPYCAEMIVEGAKKCRFCGEFLDRPRRGGVAAS